MRGSMKRIKSIYGLALAAAVLLQPAQSVAQVQQGGELYTARCAACHEAPPADALRPPPARSELNTMTPNAIYDALAQGVMRMQATGLSNDQMRSVAEFLTGKPV